MSDQITRSKWRRNPRLNQTFRIVVCSTCTQLIISICGVDVIAESWRKCWNIIPSCSRANNAESQGSYEAAANDGSSLTGSDEVQKWMINACGDESTCGFTGVHLNVFSLISGYDTAQIKLQWCFCTLNSVKNAVAHTEEKQSRMK